MHQSKQKKEPEQNASAKQGEWPPHFPEGCPPGSTTKPTKGEVFRLVETSPPTMKDALSSKERDWHKKEPDCLRAGLSCYLAPEHAQHARAAVPRLASHLVASAVLDERHGRFAQTRPDPTHYSLWLRAAFLAQFPQLFKVC
jgi:hypothetical protein